MKSTYRIVYSDIKDKPPSHLPVTMATRFRSSARAFKTAKRLWKQGRSVVVYESNALGCVCTWEFESGTETVVFDCDEELLKIMDERGIP